MSFYLTPSLDFQDGISHPAAEPHITFGGAAPIRRRSRAPLYAHRCEERSHVQALQKFARLRNVERLPGKNGRKLPFGMA
jgi:hypothetical protein